MATQNYFYALGRRKSATARVRLQNGKGNIVINGQPASEYFADSKTLLTELMRPFAALEMENTKFDVSAVVSGGGHAGQADAIRLGIAKALAIMNEDLKSTLRRADLLGRDPREKERKKFGLKGARKQRQFTKR
jgi:small subunit ribosomal protein S9